MSKKKKYKPLPNFNIEYLSEEERNQINNPQPTQKDIRTAQRDIFGILPKKEPQPKPQLKPNLLPASGFRTAQTQIPQNVYAQAYKTKNQNIESQGQNDREPVIRALEKNHPILAKPVRAYGNFLDLLNNTVGQSSVGKFADRFGERGLATAVFDPSVVKTSTGNKYADIGADALGNIAGLILPTGGANSALSAGRTAGETTLSKFAPTVTNKLAKVATAGAGAGAGLGAASSISEGKNIKGIAKETAKNAALFSLLDAGALQGPLKSALIGGSVFGGQSALAGDKKEDILINALTGAGMGALGGMGNRTTERPMNEPTPRGNDLATPKTWQRQAIENIFNKPKFEAKRSNPLEGILPRKRPVIEPRTVDVEKVKPISEQINTPKPNNQRGFINTLNNSAKVEDNLKQNLVNDNRSTYNPITNQDMVNKANERVKQLEDAHRFVMSTERATPEHITTGHRLIDEYQKMGEYEKAVDVAEKLADLGTKAGQSIQSFSIYNRLTPEGILVHAKRVIARTNSTLPKGAEPVELTAQTAAKLTDLATTMQDMKVTVKNTNSVMDILDKAKTGQKLTADETATIKSFVNDAKQFVDKVKPMKIKEPKPIKDARVRDKVVNFMDKQEQEALARIMKNRNRVSSTPIDLYKDYAIVGASKLAKGIVKFADWSEDMIKTFQDEGLRPHLEKIYNDAVEHLHLSTKKISETKLNEIEKLTEKVINNHQLEGYEAKRLREIVERVNSLAGQEKINASQGLQAELQQFEKSTIAQKLSTGQTIMQLLNPKTIVRNAIGNELFYRMEQIDKMLAVPIDITKSTLTGRERTITFSKAKGSYWNDWLTGGKAGLKGVNPEGLTTQYDLRPRTFSNKWNPLTYLERFTGATLKSFDYAGYKRVVNDTLVEMGKLDAINQGLKGEVAKTHAEQFIRNADENILSIADQYGKYVTFQDNNILSKNLSKTKSVLNEISTFGKTKDFGLGDVILKYPKTPGALAMRALDYSPAGFLRSAKLLYDAVRFGEGNDRDIILAASRAIIGTVGLTGMGYYLANKGILTGKGSSDKDVRDLEAQAGKKQYQVNMSALWRFVSSAFNDKEATPRQGDTLINYDWAQPMAISLAMGSNMKPKDGENSLYNAVSGGVNTIVEQSVLQGVKSAFETAPGETTTDKLAKIASDVPASFVPTFFNQLKQYTDNTKQSTYGTSLYDQGKNKVKAKMPGVAETLPTDYNTLGQPKEHYRNGSNSLFNVFLNPAFVENYNPSKEAKGIIDFMSKTGDTTIAPRVAPKKVYGYQLSPEEYSKLQKRMGELTKQQLTRLLPMIYNNGISDEAKIKRIDAMLTEVSKKAKKDILPNIKKK